MYESHVILTVSNSIYQYEALSEYKSRCINTFVSSVLCFFPSAPALADDHIQLICLFGA